MSFNFVALVTVCSGFGAQENEICHCFHIFPIFLPQSDGTRCHDLNLWSSWNSVWHLARMPCNISVVTIVKIFIIELLSTLCQITLKSMVVQFSCSVVSDSLRPHEPRHARTPCPSPTPGVYPNSCPLSRWCHLTILSSVIPFSSCLQSFPISGPFQMSQLFASGGQNIGVSASTSVLPVKLRTDFLKDGLVRSSCSPRDSQESSTPQFRSISSSALSFLYSPTLTSIHDYWKNHSLD